MAFGLKYRGHKIMTQTCQNSSGKQQTDSKEMA